MIALLVLAGVAAAWETDQLTRRGEPLPDLTPVANAEMDRLIALAVAATNATTACAWDDERTHALLARELHDRVGPPQRPPDRAWPRNQGYNVYGAWLEQQPGARRFDDRSDIFGELGLLQAPVLHAAGVCSTVGLAGQQVGVDKVDHFLGMGFAYWRRSREGEALDRALSYGTRTERSVFGLWTSLAFSYADLEANLDGYTFYARLTSPGSEVERGPGGCLVQARGFSWAEWIDWRYDEVLNPSVYARVARQAVDARLAASPEAGCAELEAVGGTQAWRQQLSDPSPAVRGRAPAREDSFALAARCGGQPPLAQGQ